MNSLMNFVDHFFANLVLAHLKGLIRLKLPFSFDLSYN